MPLAFFHVLDGSQGPVDPGYGGGIGAMPPNNTLPEAPPGVWPPPSIGSPIVPVGPDNTLPAQPGTIWPPVGGNASGKFWIVAGIPGVGWRYVCVDVSLRPDNSLPSGGGRPDQSLPGSQPHPDQGLPPGMPNRPSQGLPPSQARPDQGLPPTPAPKR